MPCAGGLEPVAPRSAHRSRRRELRGAGRGLAGRALGIGRRAARAPQRQPLVRRDEGPQDLQLTLLTLPQPCRRGRGGLDRPIRRSLRPLRHGRQPEQSRCRPRERHDRGSPRSPQARGGGRASHAGVARLRHDRRLPWLRRRADRPSQRPQPQAHRRRAGRAAAIAAAASRGWRGDHGDRHLFGWLHAPPGLLHRPLADAPRQSR